MPNAKEDTEVIITSPVVEANNESSAGEDVVDEPIENHIADETAIDATSSAD